MSLRYLLSALIAPLLLAQPVAANLKLGEQFFFKDWAVACDNILSCEAISLPPESMPENQIAMKVARESGISGTLSVSFTGAESKSDRYRILIDGRVADSGKLSKGASPVSLSGPDALKLVRAAVRGSLLQLRDGDNVLLGMVSLAGSAAAFRHIDQIQNRALTKAALVATGKKSRLPKTAPLPVVVARRIGAQDAIPDATAMVKLVENSDCANERFGVTEDRAYSLGRHGGKTRALVLISCGSGAYNFSFAAYVGTSSDSKAWQFEPAMFDYRNDWQANKNAINLLVNADWDAESQQLSSYAKGRGIGDCGNSETYVWTGEAFRLVSALGMEECRGSLDWMTLWRAKVEYRP